MNFEGSIRISGAQGNWRGMDVKSAAPARAASNDNLSGRHEARAFIGVILRQNHLEGERKCFEIILAHGLPDLSRLYATHFDDETVIAEWRSLGNRLRLPLWILNSTGKLEAATSDGAARGGPRRRGSTLSGRRPRFLARRITGNLSTLGLVHRSNSTS